MKYSCHGGEKPYESDDLRSLVLALQKEDMEKVLRFFVTLPINLDGFVTRRDGQERVELNSGSVFHRSQRNTADNPNGHFCVSCMPTGSSVPIQSINLAFRNIDDEMTDRGIVWVMPGRSASATLVLNLNRFSSMGQVVEIVEEAERAIKDRVIALFQR